MPQILGAKAGKLTQTDALMIAGAKILSERLLAPIIGNSSLLSGGVKMIGAVAVNKMVGGRVGDIVGTALTIDGAEDLVLAFLPNISGNGLFGQKQSNVEII